MWLLLAHNILTPLHSFLPLFSSPLLSPLNLPLILPLPPFLTFSQSCTCCQNCALKAGAVCTSGDCCNTATCQHKDTGTLCSVNGNAASHCELGACKAGCSNFGGKLCGRWGSNDCRFKCSMNGGNCGQYTLTSGGVKSMIFGNGVDCTVDSKAGTCKDDACVETPGGGGAPKEYVETII